MLLEAQSRAAAGAETTVTSTDRHRHAVAASKPDASERHCADQLESEGDTDRPPKRARTAALQQNGKVPDRTDCKQDSCAARSRANVCDIITADSRAATSHPIELTSSQLDGTGGDSDDEYRWPPDVHDTVGCVAVDGTGELPVGFWRGGEQSAVSSVRACTDSYSSNSGLRLGDGERQPASTLLMQLMLVVMLGVFMYLRLMRRSLAQQHLKLRR